MKRLLLVFILIIMHFFSHGQKKATKPKAIEGIGIYVLGKFSFEELEKKLDNSELKYENIKKGQLHTLISS